MSKKIKITEKAFLDWYFIDDEDYLRFAKNMASKLLTHGFVKESMQGLLERCTSIPGFISENPDDDKEYEPKDVELISEREPEHCYKCGHEYDNTMDNFCSNCLASK
jgi:hypothetical protein